VRRAAQRLAAESSEPKLLALRLGQELPGCGSVLAVRLVGPTSGRRDLLELPHDRTSPQAARRWAAQRARDWGAGALVPELQICVSELCANAFMHSATPVRVVVAREAWTLVVVVHNGGVGQVTRRAATDPEAVGGRGLLMVEALADDWGWHVGAEGTTVWCRLAG
jgi:anti-sigma regulatory factor (Ser/Thr protein kinase)